MKIGYDVTLYHVLAFLLVGPQYMPVVFLRSLVAILLIVLGLQRLRQLFDSKLPSPVYGCPMGERFAYLHIPLGLRLVSYREKETAGTLYDVFVLRVYERYYRLSRNDTIVDIGAHVGSFTVRAAKKACKGLVVALEPHPENFQLLLRNVELNGLTNVIALQVACGSTSGKARLVIGAWSSAHRLADIESSKNVGVRVATLDDLLDEVRVSHVSMIKIDAEGAELDILRGADSVLRRDRPKLSIAAYHFPSEDHEIADFLGTMGFNVKVRGGYVYAA